MRNTSSVKLQGKREHEDGIESAIVQSAIGKTIAVKVRKREDGAFVVTPKRKKISGAISDFRIWTILFPTFQRDVRKAVYIRTKKMSEKMMIKEVVKELNKDFDGFGFIEKDGKIYQEVFLEKR